MTVSRSQQSQKSGPKTFKINIVLKELSPPNLAHLTDVAVINTHTQGQLSVFCFPEIFFSHFIIFIRILVPCSVDCRL